MAAIQIIASEEVRYAAHLFSVAELVFKNMTLYRLEASADVFDHYRYPSPHEAMSILRSLEDELRTAVRNEIGSLSMKVS